MPRPETKSNQADRAQRLTLLCHASTDAARRGALPGDDAIDAHGVDDCRRLAPSLGSFRSVSICPSPAARGTATALALAGDELAALPPRALGLWAGRDLAAIASQEGEDAVRAFLSDPAMAPPGGESMADVLARVGRFLDLPHAGRSSWLVVAHSETLRAAVAHALGAPAASMLRLDVAPLCRVRLTRPAGSVAWRLRAILPPGSD